MSAHLSNGHVYDELYVYTIESGYYTLLMFLYNDVILIMFVTWTCMYVYDKHTWVCMYAHGQYDNT